MTVFRFDDMRHVTNFLPVLFALGLLNCTNQSQADKIVDERNQFHDTIVEPEEPIQLVAHHFSRDTIQQRLKSKISTKQTRIIHVFVPLCDNEFQGIVPVNASLGNGMNLRTNLYWGAGYGIKTHFKKSSKWQLVSSTLNLDSNVLERIVLRHINKDVVMIADGYRGDRMQECVLDYFNTIAGRRQDTISISDSVLAIGSSTDLVVFNGHNGLMDVTIDTIYNVDGRLKDAVAIACASYSYYVEYLNSAGGYPLVLTANLLAPEAYVLDHVVDAWMENSPPEKIRFAAAQGYHSIQKCGIRGASNLFVTGWDN